MEKSYWDKRWRDRETGWDIGQVSTPLKAYFDQLTDKKMRILIPGCGNAHEAEYLWEKGFSNTFIVEIAALAVDSFLKRYPKFPKNQIIIGDFFELQDQFDLIVEQTFFCALDPAMRSKYVEKMAELLKPGDKLVGVLFNRPFEGGPPFGGNGEEYENLFKNFFYFKTFETAYNSIAPRAGTELFINFIRNDIEVK